MQRELIPGDTLQHATLGSVAFENLAGVKKNTIMQLGRYEARLERTVFRAMRELERRPPDSTSSPRHWEKTPLFGKQTQRLRQPRSSRHHRTPGSTEPPPAKSPLVAETNPNPQPCPPFGENPVPPQTSPQVRKPLTSP